MTRILFTIASLSIVLVSVALILGLSIGNLYDEPSQSTLHWATIHRLTGVAAALAVVFVESVVVTYFVGTSRWCREVVETYKFDRSFILASNRLKRKTFPWALLGMLTAVGIVALGGASDPATGRSGTAEWASFHLMGALLGIGLILWTYYVAWTNIAANHENIRAVLAKVAEVRQASGLDNASFSARVQENTGELNRG